MQGFFHTILSLPTLPFTIILGLLLVYWLFMILGAVDLEFLDLDVDFDLDADLDIDASLTGIAGLLSSLGLLGIPITISLSVFTLSAWAIALLGTNILGGGSTSMGTLMVALVGLGAIVIATPVTSLSLRPFRSAFVSQRGFRGADAVIGHSVKITSGQVTSSFGRATVIIEGAQQEFSIRCDDPNNDLQRGDEALVIGYDAEKHTYLVEPMDSVLGTSQETTGVSLTGTPEEASEELHETASQAK